MRLILRCCRAAVLLLLAVAARAYGEPGELPFKYAHRAWSIGQGMPQSTVECIAQDRAGYIWAGTQDGIVRFDGIRFKTFNQRNVRGFGDGWVRSIHASRDGSVWFTNGGLVRLKDGVFQTWPGKSFPGTLRQIDEGTDGSLWIASSRGLIRFRGGSIRIYGKTDGLLNEDVTSHVVDAAGMVWLATPAGVLRYDGHNFQRIGLPGIEQNANALARGRDGTVLIATPSRILRFNQGRFTAYPPGTFNGRRVRVLHEDSHGVLRVAFAFVDGIARLEGDRFVRDPANVLLTDHSVQSIFEDREHILWVGTLAGGLNQFRSTPFTTYGVSDGVAGESTEGLFADSSGTVWIGTAGEGLTRYANGRFRSYGTKEGLTQGFIHGIEEDSTGTLWLAKVGGGGVQRFREKPLSSITTKNGLLSDSVYDVHFDQGTMWMATTKGLTAVEGTHFRHYTEADGLATSDVTRIAGANDRLWIGTSAGLHLLHHGRITKTPVRGWVISLYQSGNGTVWVGTIEGGLWRIRHGRFTHYSLSDGLFDATMNSILEDGDGFLWLTSNRGVSRVRLRELDEFDRTKKKFRSEVFSTSDGMVSPETNAAAPGMIRDRAGRIWIATTRGVVVLDPAVLKGRLPLTASVAFESVTVDGRSSPPGNLDVPPGMQHLVFHYAGIHFMAPEKIRFRYRLLGFDRQWVDAGDQRQAHYTHVPPGQYRLEVAARVADGPWSPTVASMPLIVRPFFWQTTWFRAVCAAILIALPFILIRIRMLRMKQSQRILKQMVYERTALLDEANRRMKLVLESANEGILGIGAGGQTTFINPAGAQMLGWQEEELIGRELHPRVHPTSEGSLCPICATPQQREKPNMYGTFLTRNGSIPVDFTFAKGNGNAVVVTFRDATARLAFERARNEFVATVSHELRTPLTSIRGALGLLAGGGVAPQSDRAQRMLNIGISNTERLLRLVNDILDAERLASGTVELNRATFPASTVITRTVELMQTLAEDAEVHIEADLLPIEICADFDRMLQTLTNLIANAIKFSSPHSVVRVGVEGRGDRVVFSVADSGRGIPPEKLNSIFERFQQVEARDATQKGGSGLGLAICRGIAEAHGGRVWATSRLGEGSTFYIEIPGVVGVETKLAS